MIQVKNSCMQDLNCNAPFMSFCCVQHRVKFKGTGVILAGNFTFSISLLNIQPATIEKLVY